MEILFEHLCILFSFLTSNKSLLSSLWRLFVFIFSGYLLTKAEGKVGSPERPLSDLGLMSYRKYWQDRLINYLLDYDDDKISIKGNSVVRVMVMDSHLVDSILYLTLNVEMNLLKNLI